MEKKPFIKINVIVLIAILVQVVFIILIIITFNRFSGNNDGILGVEVSGLVGEVENLPEYSKKDIEYSLYSAMVENAQERIIQKKGIYIREGSLISNYYENLKMYYVNFIVDISDIKQSYRVINRWFDNGSQTNGYTSGVATGVLCLDNDELIYGEFDCKPYREYMKYVIIDSLLGLGQDEIGNNIILTSEYRDNMEDYKVKMEYFGCDTMCYCRVASEEEKKLAVEKFEGFIKGLGFKAEDVPIYFDNCEGDEVWIDEKGAFHLGARL